MMSRLRIVSFAAALLAAGCSFDPSGPGVDDAFLDDGAPRADARRGPDGAPGSPDAARTGADAGTLPGTLLALDGKQWLLPCTAPIGSNNCYCDSTQLVFSASDGTGASYDVTVRIRGALEPITYVNGTANGAWYVGGNPGDGANNIYKLTISSPQQHYWLNHGSVGPNYSLLYDYTASFTIDDGATVTLDASGQDDRQWANVDDMGVPIVIPGVVTDPTPYDGQFAQMNVIDYTVQ